MRGQADCSDVPGEGQRGWLFVRARQRSEQYFTFSQSRAHFLHQVNGRPHTAQSFAGLSLGLRPCP